MRESKRPKERDIEGEKDRVGEKGRGKEKQQEGEGDRFRKGDGFRKGDRDREWRICLLQGWFLHGTDDKWCFGSKES